MSLPRAVADLWGMISTMNVSTKSAATTTIDTSGRLVLPKRIREQAGFTPGSLLEIRCFDGRVEIEPAAVDVDLVDGEDGLPLLVPRQPVPTLNQATVRATLERIRNRDAGP